jgi:glycerophosphoryl diester phosphodiesterase
MTRARGRHPYLEGPLPIAFAHRGGAIDLPENSMPAFTAAVELGYRYIETDVHATADGVLVAFHDPALDRVTDAHGEIATLTAAQVGAAEAGYDFTPDGGRSFPFRGRGLRVPLLAELLESLPEVRVNIDVKAWNAVTPLARLLTAMNVFDRVCVGAFSDRRVSSMRGLCGERLCTSMGPRAVAAARLASVTGRIPTLGADCLQVPVSTERGRLRIVDSRMVRAAHASGLQLHVWTIDDATEMARLLDLGVDGIMTDRPTVLRDVLAGRGLWHGGH